MSFIKEGILYFTLPSSTWAYPYNNIILSVRYMSSSPGWYFAYFTDPVASAFIASSPLSLLSLVGKTAIAIGHISTPPFMSLCNH